MTEKEILQQQEVNEQKAFYLIAVGMFYHAYGNGAFALARATGYRVLRKHRKHGDILTCGFPANQLDTVLQRIRAGSGDGSLICSQKMRTENGSQSAASVSSFRYLRQNLRQKFGEFRNLSYLCNRY